MRRTFLAVAMIAAAVPASAQEKKVIQIRAYQGRNSGPEQTDHFTGKYKIARDGRVSIQNISGDITVTAGSGDEVSVDAIKRTRGPQSQLGSVRIDVDAGSNHVDIRTVYTARSDRMSVDYAIQVPAGVTLEAHSISGTVKATGVRGAVRLESLSGNIVAADTPRLTNAKSMSGNVSVSGVSEGDLSAGSVSGSVTARSVKVRSLELNSISGDLNVSDATCERLGAKSISGSLEYAGGIAKGGSYDINLHSGNVRLMLANPAGFALTANTFSGTIRSALALTLGGADDGVRRSSRTGLNRSIRATFGDGSATLTIRTFSGDIVIDKR
jgi:DUF4097 and DUF4098 domain-containing protein YvlB